MYGLLMATALLVAVGLSWLRARKRGADGDKLLSIALIAIILGIIGAKALYMVVTYSWSEFVDAVKANGFMWILQGGLVFYGGLIGGVIGAFLGAKFVKVKLSSYSDAIVPTMPLAHAIGRMGCFCAGCCYGKVTESWIGMSFPAAGLAEGVRVIPTQLIEAGANILVFLFLLWFTRKRRKGFTSLYVYLIIYGVERFLIEYLRGDEIRGIFGAFSTSQWISIALVAAAIVALALTRVLEKRKEAEEPDIKPEAED